MSCTSNTGVQSFKKLTLLVLAASAIVLYCHDALAHRVIVFAFVEGDTVHTTSKFPGGKRVKNGEIVVKDLQGNTLLQGVTDENGKFSFMIPKKEALKVILKAGMGHMAEWTIPANEITGAASETADVSSETSTDPETKNRAPESASSTSVSSDEIQIAIEKALDRRLQPVVALLERIHEPKTTLKDILGGLGYIVGLVGIAAYIRSIKERSKKKDP